MNKKSERKRVNERKNNKKKVDYIYIANVSLLNITNAIRNFIKNNNKLLQIN